LGATEPSLAMIYLLFTSLIVNKKWRVSFS
jgi:hypothetical protein